MGFPLIRSRVFAAMHQTIVGITKMGVNYFLATHKLW